MVRRSLSTLFVVLLLTPAGLGQQPRPLTPDDIFAIKNVADPHVSPDGTWVAYTVSQMDRQKDASDTDIYMAPLAGGDPVRVTTSDKAETSPRCSGTFQSASPHRRGAEVQRGSFLSCRVGRDLIGGATSRVVS